MVDDRDVAGIVAEESKDDAAAIQVPLAALNKRFPGSAWKS
jgi:hypothetical protein